MLDKLVDFINEQVIKKYYNWKNKSNDLNAHTNELIETGNKQMRKENLYDEDHMDDQLDIKISSGNEINTERNIKSKDNSVLKDLKTTMNMEAN